MKTKITALLFIVGLLSGAAVAQSVTVTSNTVTYTRKKPIQEFKKNFTITYPKVKASTPAVSRKIEAALSYQKVLGLNLKEELRDIQWLHEANYDVEYNKHGILGVSLWMEGSGAYPSGTTRRVVLDSRTGNALRPADLFTGLPGLLAMVRKAQKTEVAEAIKELKKDPENTDIEGPFKESAKYHPLKLDQFMITDKGVIFHHDYDFAHVIKAWEPDGEFTFTWAQLRPYIRRGGLLAPLAR